MKTILLIVRHGQTELNLEHKMDGQKDTSLTDLGLEQTKKLGEFLSNQKIDIVYSSPLSRAIKTAESIIKCQTNKLKINIVDSLKEINCGECTNLSRDEVAVKFPKLIQEWNKNTDPPFPDGENLRDVEARALPVIKSLIYKHPGKTILISGHGSLNVAIIGYFLQIPHAMRFKIRQDNCCVNILEFQNNQLSFVRGVNILPQ